MTTYQEEQADFVGTLFKFNPSIDVDRALCDVRLACRNATTLHRYIVLQMMGGNTFVRYWYGVNPFCRSEESIRSAYNSFQDHAKRKCESMERLICARLSPHLPPGTAIEFQGDPRGAPVCIHVNDNGAMRRYTLPFNVYNPS